MATVAKENLVCTNCGAEADIVLEGFETAEDVIKRKEKKKIVCKNCGREIEVGRVHREPAACEHCGSEADMSLEGLEKVEDVIKRNKKMTCGACGKDIAWTRREDIKAIEVAMEAEKEASQLYGMMSKKTKNPRGRDMFGQLSDFEMNHYNRLRELAKSLQEKGEWIHYPGTSLKNGPLAIKADQPEGKDQLTDMDALRLAIREEKKAGAYYRSMAVLANDPRGKDMYKRLAGEEELHEKLLNDQYYSLHNTGIWSWGD